MFQAFFLSIRCISDIVRLTSGLIAHHDILMALSRACRQRRCFKHPLRCQQNMISINQEKYLRVFLSDGNVPMDNNRAEQAIRPFTLGRKNLVNMDSIRGAQASAILYSLVETAKANNMRVYEYLELLLTGLAEHADDTDRDF